jgi:hypothetical protein
MRVYQRPQLPVSPFGQKYDYIAVPQYMKLDSEHQTHR